MRRPVLLSAVTLAALTCAYTWPLIGHLSSSVPHDRGDPLLVTWILWWSTHTVPLTAAWWNAPAFYYCKKNGRAVLAKFKTMPRVEEQLAYLLEHLAAGKHENRLVLRPVGQCARVAPYVAPAAPCRKPPPASAHA